ncbi:MAG: hypothetical protein GXO79_12375 [Chlorobi bacterium]|nr:hypothetical protein [Chlorobiota bacterium]
MNKIKYINYKYILLLTVSIIWANPFYGQMFTEEKKLVKSFKVNSSTTVEVTNKYGRIQIIPWDVDSVHFEIDLLIKSDNISRLQKVKNSIDFEFVNTKYYVLAKTNFENQYNGIISELKELSKDFTDFFSGSDYQVKINYLIMIPDYVNIKLDNKYGDVYTDNLKGDFSLKLSNGNFKANSLTGSSNIDIKFGNASITNINTCKFNISYADLEVKKADQLNIESKSSKITIDKINTLKLNSRRDKVYVTETDYLYGESTFSDLWIYESHNDISYTSNYGNLNLELISKDFKLININSKYTTLNLFFEPESGYSVDLNYKNTVINLPQDIAKIETQAVPGEDKKFIAFGTIGENNNGSKLKINAESGNLNIFHRKQ